MGHSEIHHTADVAIQVWADNLPNLFTEAARGMYAIMGVVREEELGKEKKFSMQSADDESLLVAFLNELLYEAEQNRIAFMDVSVSISDGQLTADLSGGQLMGKIREVKAVTYHNLKIIESDQGVQVTIVFDV